jgi:hypothetical protein
MNVQEMNMQEDHAMPAARPTPSIPCGRRTGLTAMLVGATLVCLATGCGTHEPSYKDRIGTVDPAKAPIMLPDSPAPKPKNRQ